MNMEQINIYLEELISLIGLTGDSVSIVRYVILVIASFLLAWLAGWGSAAFPDSVGGFFWVYILCPIIGGALASYFFTLVLEPAMIKK